MLDELQLKRRVDRAGSKSALMEKKDWTMLDLDLIVYDDGEIYYEISHTKFWFDLGKLKRKGDTKLICSGNSHVDDTDLEEVWNHYIDKLNPDEYFVDQASELDLEQNPDGEWDHLNRA